MQGFKHVTWNFTEVSHEKGAPYQALSTLKKCPDFWIFACGCSDFWDKMEAEKEDAEPVLEVGKWVLVQNLSLAPSHRYVEIFVGMDMSG